MTILSPQWLKVLSGLFVDLAAGWFGVVFIAPGIVSQSLILTSAILTKNFLLGTLCLVIAKKMEDFIS
ncbi:hypothetical protein HZB78_02435 [Candidatus Collierbacteria bacterium]|nr:hypothetical protein [Candidatus Collierbacteria bacterium]